MRGSRSLPTDAATFKEVSLQFPLSRDEHAAMARYVSGIRKQLQDISDLFTTRYGKDSSIAETAVKTLVSSTLLEHELLMLETDHQGSPDAVQPSPSSFF